jgi:hypothetical protein
MVFELTRLEIRTAPKVLATSFNYYRAGKVVETLSTFFFRSSYTAHYTAVENLVEWKGRKKKKRYGTMEIIVIIIIIMKERVYLIKSWPVFPTARATLFPFHLLSNHRKEKAAGELLVLR